MSSKANPPAPANGEAPARLEGWKEIAAYLKRDVRTVQRWEKREGLPVHRHLHEQRGTTWAEPAELDAWWRERRATLEENGGPAQRVAARFWWMAAGAGALAVAVVAGWMAGLPAEDAAAKGLRAPGVTVTRIAETGDFWGTAAISPDGKYVAYTSSGTEKGITLWLHQTATGSRVRLLNFRWIGHPTFSPDGEFIYFTGRAELGAPATVFALPTLGGTPRKVLGKGVPIFALSPDGSQLAYVDGGYWSREVVVAKTDGSAERVLAKRLHPESLFSRFAVSWSPDGRQIATILGEQGWHGRRVALLSAEDGSLLWESKQHWPNARNVQWLPDGRGLLVTAFASAGEDFAQLWLVSYPEGTARRLTFDTNDYSGLSLARTDAGPQLVTQYAVVEANIFLLDPESGEEQRATTGPGRNGLYGLAWMPDGRLVYDSRTTGERDLYVAVPGGGEPLRLTHGMSPSAPAVSPDGSTVVFTSVSEGPPRLWQIDSNGLNLQPAVDHSSGVSWNPSFSPDGTTLYFQRMVGTDSRLWRKDFRTGTEEQVSEMSVVNPRPSPDGKWLLAHPVGDARPFAVPNRPTLLPLEAGQEARYLDIPLHRRNVAWRPDGSSLAFLRESEKAPETVHVWNYPLDGGPVKQLTSASSSAPVGQLAWSPDGKRLAITRSRRTTEVILVRGLF